MAKKTKKNLILRKKLLTVAWFLIKFNLLAIPMYLVLYFNLSYPPIQEFLTEISTPFIELFGYHTSVQYVPYCNAPVIFVNDFIEIECISWDCTGWKSMYVLAALAIATPFIAWKKKWKFLTVGIPLIFLINYLRIVTTILIKLKFGEQYFNLVHSVLWREGLILIIVAIWYIWLRRIKYNIQ